MVRVRSAPPLADGGRHVFAAGGRRRAPRVGMSRSPASLHLSGAQGTSPSPSLSYTRSIRDDGGGYLDVAAGQGRGPALKIQVISFLQASKSTAPPPHPLANALLPSGAPARAALGQQIQRLAHRSSNHDRTGIDFAILLHFGC
jgi:hypothetical protein